MKKQFIYCLAFLCSFLTYSQTFDSQKIDSLLNSLDTENMAMGTVSIFKEGKEIYQKSIGFKNLNNSTKANELTKYRIASVSKAFTATIILQLAEEGKLKLTDYVSKYFPKVPNSNSITIENLLYHRSGLYDLTNEKGFELWISKPRKRKEILEKIIQNGTVFQPNDKAAYSNTNYVLLSYIAEEVDKKRFAKIFKERIVKPLNLKRTQFGGDINLKKNEASSYYWENSKWNPITIETNLTGPMGAGGIISTAKEVNIFYNSLFSGQLISSEFLQQMITSKENMGMGLHINNYKGLKLYAHAGAMDGFRSMAVIIPEKGLSACLTFNATKIAVPELLINILETYFSNDPTMNRKVSIALTSDDLDKYLGTYGGEGFPAKVTFTKKGNILFAQATGQPIFELIAEKKDVFTYDVMGISFRFNTQQKTLKLLFGDKEYLLKKE